MGKAAERTGGVDWAGRITSWSETVHLWSVSLAHSVHAGLWLLWLCASQLHFSNKESVLWHCLLDDWKDIWPVQFPQSAFWHSSLMWSCVKSSSCLTSFSRTTWVCRYQDFNDRDDGFLDGSGISQTICKQSALNSRHITMPAPHHSIFISPDSFSDAKPTILKHWWQ